MGETLCSRIRSGRKMSLRKRVSLLGERALPQRLLAEMKRWTAVVMGLLWWP
jgi:hypothetical protein